MQSKFQATDIYIYTYIYELLTKSLDLIHRLSFYFGFSCLGYL